MDDFPLISVITPTYNIIDNELVDDFNILTTLLNKQSYPNIEHIIIDKASTDGTVQLLSDYKSKGYIQFYSEPDMGRFDALNKGIMRAKGDFIAFLNPSDFIHDIMALEEIVTKMLEEGADYSFGTSYALHPDGYILPFEPAILNVFQVVPCPLQAMVFTKAVLNAENFFDTKFKTLADFDLIMRLVMKEYPGIQYEKNYVTYKISKNVTDIEQQLNESRQVYIKNFRSIYPLTNEIVDKITRYSEFPQDLLEKLSAHFPEEYKESFFLACEEMHKIRVEALAEQTEDITAEQPNPENETTETIQNNQQVTPPQQNTVSPVQNQQSQMSGMSGQPIRQTNPQTQPRFKMPGQNMP